MIAQIDGRNRLEACRRAGVEPKRETLKRGQDPVALIASANAPRRHMSKAQKAVVAARAYLLNISKTQQELARAFGVSQQYLGWAMIAEGTGIPGQAVIHWHLAVLAREGKLVAAEGTARGYRLPRVARAEA